MEYIISKRQRLLETLVLISVRTRQLFILVCRSDYVELKSTKHVSSFGTICMSTTLILILILILGKKGTVEIMLSPFAITAGLGSGMILRRSGDRVIREVVPQVVCQGGLDYSQDR